MGRVGFRSLSLNVVSSLERSFLSPYRDSWRLSGSAGGPGARRTWSVAGACPAATSARLGSSHFPTCGEHSWRTSHTAPSMIFSCCAARGQRSPTRTASAPTHRRSGARGTARGPPPGKRGGRSDLSAALSGGTRHAALTARVSGAVACAQRTIVADEGPTPRRGSSAGGAAARGGSGPGPHAHVQLAVLPARGHDGGGTKSASWGLAGQACRVLGLSQRGEAGGGRAWRCPRLQCRRRPAISRLGAPAKALAQTLSRPRAEARRCRGRAPHTRRRPRTPRGG
jgi:hypothetical protein